MRYINQAISVLTFCVIFISTPLQAESKRIGIVFSHPTAEHFWDDFSYRQLFMSMQQQSMMAGIPYDLLTEDDLLSKNLNAYNALLIPYMQNVTASKRTAIITALTNASANGVGILTSGNFLTNDESGADFGNSAYEPMNNLLGLQDRDYYIDGLAATLRISQTNHPVTKNYQTGEALASFEQTWFGAFEPVAGQQANVLAIINSNGQDTHAVIATVRGGRNVHFINLETMSDTNLMWTALQWSVNGNDSAVALKLGRDKSIFISRNDMDSSLYADEVPLTDVPLLDIISNWKAQYNFVGSYYLNIGNNPAQGEYTNWDLSGPLFNSYLQLGNEIGTHSWTHHHQTSSLSAAQLEFEFNQSKIELSQRLNTTVTGAAIPGEAENLFVDRELDKYLSYISGRYGAVGSGFKNAFGRLEPGFKSIYFSLNMWPDFTAVEWFGNTPQQAEQLWRNQYNGIQKHASQPIVHWMWHDYAATIGTAAGTYNLNMFSNTIAMAYADNSEFVTSDNLQNRIRSFEKAKLSVTGSNPIRANINASGVGQFSILIDSNQRIQQVSNWYAYDDDQVFLPDNGGQFEIKLGSTASDVTHITKLPMRARLMALTGDGDNLSFTFNGEGTIKIQLSTAIAGTANVTGADSFSVNGNILSMSFHSNGLHSVTVDGSTPTNHPPVFVSNPINLTAATVNTAYTGTLANMATDSDGDNLLFSLLSGPEWLILNTDGSLSGTPASTDTSANNWIVTVLDGKGGQDQATLSMDVDGQAATEVTFISIGQEDGRILERSETSNTGRSRNTSSRNSSALRIGDDRRDKQYKSFLSFDTSSLPDGAIIESVRLELTRGKTSGSNPFSTHGSAYIDIKRGFFGTRAALDSSDFQAAADASQVAIISSQGNSGASYRIDLNNAQTYINPEGRTQMRLAFSLDDNDDRGTDYAGFYSGDTLTQSRRPRLIVTYK